MIIKNKKKERTIALTIAFAALIVAGLLLLVFKISDKDSPTTASDITENRPSSSDEEQSETLTEAPEIKESVTNTDRPPHRESPSSDKRSIEMIISSEVSANTVYIRGGINDIVSPDGECFAQLHGPNGESVRKDTALLRNPTTTDCKTISFPSSELSPGRWSLSLNYLSDSMKGVSDEITIAIP